jgi:NADPH:quinone reductase-like Zn-dependent oxidoreductase
VAACANAAEPLSCLRVGEHDREVPPGWVTVGVRAAALNHHDLWTLRGVATPEENLPIVLGSDAAGLTEDGREVLVHAVVPDPGVESHRALALGAGMSILSERVDGTHAERVAVPPGNVVDKPGDLSFVEAACLPTAWLTAYRMLFACSGVRPGDRVLVQGATGGVATAGIQLARAAGLHVTATSRRAEGRQRALELGAHDAVEPGERVPQRVEAVLETVGEATYGHSLRALQPGGTVVVAGGTTGVNPPAELNRIFARSLRVVGTSMGTHAELEALTRMLVATGLRPTVDSSYALAEAAAAYERLAAGGVVGKVVLTNP